MRFIFVSSRFLLTACLTGCLTVAPIGCSAETPPASATASSSDPTVRVEAGNPEMEAAFRKGRETLPRFWNVLANPTNGESDFAVKVPLKQDGHVEYFWVESPNRTGTQVTGRIGNDPEFVKRVSFGDTIEFAESEIVDWMYMRNGKLHGNYTMRPLLGSLSPEERAQLEAILAEP